MGLYRETFVPADPPDDGRYIIWRKGELFHQWHEAWLCDGEWAWPRGEGPISDVHHYMDLGQEEPTP